MDDSNSSNADPDYLPPNDELSPGQLVSDSPLGDFSRRGHRERSLTPFLRSQGRADGHGLVFNSRISPSPNRSIHKRRRRHPSRLTDASYSATESESEANDLQSPNFEFQVPAKKISRRNITKELKDESLKREKRDTDMSGKDQVDRSERKKAKYSMQEMDQRGHHSVTSKYSTSVTTHGERRHRVRKYEVETVDRKVTLRTKDKVISQTSDYSSQSASDTERDIVTSTPIEKGPAKVAGRRDSLRLKVFDGDDWIHSPRTGYTYASSLTYRDRVTPGREVPMPHMTRLPLDGYEGVVHTELWDQSEIEVRKERLRTLAEYSEDEGSPPHRIYRRQNLGTELSKSSNLFSKFFYLIFLPFSIAYSSTKYLIRKVVYDIPAYTHKIDINLLMKSEHTKDTLKDGFLLRSWTKIQNIFLYLFYAIYYIFSLPVTTANTTLTYLISPLRTNAKELNSPAEKQEDSDLISEDDDKSGLTEFMSAQKQVYSYREHLEDKKNNEVMEEYESLLMKLTTIIKYYASFCLLPFSTISRLWGEFLDNVSETSSEKSDTELKGETQVMRREQSTSQKTARYLQRVMFSFVNSVGPSVTGNYLITENMKSPKRVIFKDIPEMPDTGAVSPVIVEDFSENGSKEGSSNSDYHIIPAREELQLNFKEEDESEEAIRADFKESKIENDSSVFSWIGFIVLPFTLMKNLFIYLCNQIINISTYLFTQKQEIRRSRRLQGLHPENNSVQKEEEPQIIEKDKFQTEEIPERKKKLQKTSRREKNLTWYDWFISIFYRKKEVRRSRRLRGLAPEEVELQRRKQQQKRKSMTVTEEETEESSDIDEENEERELIIYTFFYSWYEKALSIFNWNKEYDIEIAELSESEKENVSKINLALKPKQLGFFQSIKNFFYFLLYKKQVRRSRRLRGLNPEHDGYQKTQSRSKKSYLKDDEYEETYEEFYQNRLFSTLKSIIWFVPNLLKRGQEEDNNSVAVNDISTMARETESQLLIEESGILESACAFIYSIFFKKQVRQKRHMYNLRPRNGKVNQGHPLKESEENITLNSEYNQSEDGFYEFVLISWIKSFTTRLAGIFFGRQDGELSVQNLRRHNKNITNECGQQNAQNEQKYSVIRWLKDQYGNKVIEKEIYANGKEAATMADLSFEEAEAQKMKENLASNGLSNGGNDQELTKKSKNIFSFLFLGFLPSWNTTWFWNSKSSRRSRRIIGKDPVEIDAYNTWKAKSLEDDDSIEMNQTHFVEENEKERHVSPFCCMLMLLPLILGILLLACYNNQSICKQPAESISNLYGTTYNISKGVGNTIVKEATDYSLKLLSSMHYLMNAMKENLRNTMNYLTIEGGIVNAATFLFNKIGSSLSYSFQGIYNMISSVPLWLWNHISSLGASGIDTISPFTKDFDIFNPSKIKNWVEDFLTSTSLLLNETLSSAKNVLLSVTGSFLSNILEAVSLIFYTFTASLSGIAETSLVGLKSFFLSMYNGLFTIGRQIPNYLGESISSSFNWILSSMSSTFTYLAGFELAYPFKWMWLNGILPMCDYGMNLGLILMNVFYDASSSILSNMSHAADVSSTFLKDSSASMIEYLKQIGKDVSIFSLPTTMIELGSSSIASLASGISFCFIQGSFLASAAWERTNNFLWTRKEIPAQEASINYELLIEKVLNSDKFLQAVSKIANDKVGMESLKFQEQLTTKITEEKLAQDKESAILDEYKSRIEGIKVEVSGEIKKMTEDFIRANLESTEAKSRDYEQSIASLKEKYQQLLQEAEAAKIGINTQTEVIKTSNQELQNQIEEMKLKIRSLEEEHVKMDSNLRGCCQNLTAIEIKVEGYIQELLDGIMNNRSDNSGKPVENFAAWVNSYFVAKSEIEEKLAALSTEIDVKMQRQLNTDIKTAVQVEAQQTAQQIMESVSNSIRLEHAERIKEAQTSDTKTHVEGLSKEEVLKIVKDALIQYDADKTGMFDYALETAGGSVVSTRCTETYVQKTAMYSIFGIPIWYPSNNPRTIIQPGVQPGECWAFKGSSGFVVIQLSDKIIPTRFSMEHISKSMSPSGKVDSAPKDFEVYGLRHEKDTQPVKLGEYFYSQDKDPLQFYEVQNATSEAFPFIELDVMSNHGNLNYTCLYRFRVHGVHP